MSPPRHTSFPGLEGMLDRRRALISELVTTRKERGLSQTEIAAQMGTSQSAVARLERGDVDVRLSTVERYAAVLGQTVDYQLRGQEEP
jgi:transcriptional regulator with XRE-family HTH domain